MKTVPTPKESIRSLFRHMIALFEGEKHPRVDLVYQFVFTDIDAGFPVYIRFSKGTAEFREARHDQPSIVIHASSDIWLDIAGGFRNPLWAMITKKIKVAGDLAILKRLTGLLTRKIVTPQSQKFPHQWRPPSKALVLIGNPRKKNGLTSFYLQPFLEGIQNAGATTEEIYLYDKKINHCLGCFACWTKTPGICIQRDDQQEILEKMQGSELIIYALPLYYHSLPGLVKAHLDRQLPLHHPYLEKAGALTRHPRRKAIKQSMALFSICGFPEVEQFEPLVKTFEAYTQQDNVALAAKVLLPAAMELYHNPTKRSLLLSKLDRLREAGEQLVERGQIRRSTLKAISKTTVTRDWIDRGNMYWHDEMAAGKAIVP